MGCGISKYELEEASRGREGGLKILRTNLNNGAVSDTTLPNKQLLETPEHNANTNYKAKDSKTNASDEENDDDDDDDDGGGSSGQEDEKDDNTQKDSIRYPGSPSFRDYCLAPKLFADGRNDDSPIVQRLRKQESKQESKRGRIGRGFKNVGKVKNLLSHPPASNNEAPQKPQVRAWD